MVIAALGALNRWRSVPAAATSLRPLRRIAGGELAAGRWRAGGDGRARHAATAGGEPAGAPLGIERSGADFGTTVRVDLTAASDQPGPNRFVVRAVDYDSKTPVRARRVSLRFTPLDDPGVEPTSLALAPGPGDSYVGSGAEHGVRRPLARDVLIERTRDSVEVPLEVETRIAAASGCPSQRLPGQAPTYTRSKCEPGTTLSFSPDPERPGPSKIVRERASTSSATERPIESDGRHRRHRGPDAPTAGAACWSRSGSSPTSSSNAGREHASPPSREPADGARLRAEIVIDVPASDAKFLDIVRHVGRTYVLPATPDVVVVSGQVRHRVHVVRPRPFHPQLTFRAGGN